MELISIHTLSFSSSPSTYDVVYGTAKKKKLIEMSKTTLLDREKEYYVFLAKIGLLDLFIFSTHFPLETEHTEWRRRGRTRTKKCADISKHIFFYKSNK